MRITRLAVSLLLWAVLGTSCRRELRWQEYLTYYTGNDGANLKKIGTEDLDYSFRLCPPQLMALQEIAHSDKGVSEAAFEGAYRKIEGNTYFLIDVRSRKEQFAVNGGMAKDALVAYYQTQLQNDFHLEVAPGEQLKPAYVEHEDSYGLSPYDRVLVCFNYRLADAKNDLVLCYDDKLRFNPKLRVLYSANEIHQLPALQVK